MGKSYSKNKVTILLREYTNKHEFRETLRRSTGRIKHLVDTSPYERFSVRVIYKDKVENESIIGDREYIKNIISIFTEKKLVEDILN